MRADHLNNGKGEEKESQKFVTYCWLLASICSIIISSNCIQHIFYTFNLLFFVCPFYINVLPPAVFWCSESDMGYDRWDKLGNHAYTILTPLQVAVSMRGRLFTYAIIIIKIMTVICNVVTATALSFFDLEGSTNAALIPKWSGLWLCWRIHLVYAGSVAQARAFRN